jgi:tetratricopeptide (TPR) repeat protein
MSTLVGGYVVHGLLRRRAGVPLRGVRPLSPLVGRTQELALLHERLALAASGQGQVVGIAGEPGMGKSRLLAEFAHSLGGQPVTYCEGHCLAYGNATPYGPVRDLLRQLWGLPDTVAPDTLIATIPQRLHTAGIVAEGGALLLLQFLDVTVDTASLATLSPQERRAQTFALLRQIVLHASQQQPLVLAVENLHWSDPTSDEWLAAVAARVGGMAMLLLATYRPGYRLPWLTHSWAMQVTLPLLTPPDSLTVVQAVPQATQLSAHQHQAIVAQAGGNPFFLEELTWATVANGDHTHTLPLPDTIEAVLAARIDRLPPEEKRLLQTAAVIGTEVPLPLLQAIADVPETALHRRLEHLQAAEFLYETRLFPTPEYTFKHALTHEVVYNSLLLERRRGLHARIVEAFEALVPERVAEQVDRLAHHALRGEVWGKAVTYLRQAGDRAMMRSAFREAMACWEQALTALPHLDEQQDTRVQAIDLCLALENALLMLGNPGGRRIAYLREAETLAEALGDQRRLGQICDAMSHHCYRLGDHDNAIAYAQRTLTVASGDAFLQARAYSHLGTYYCSLGDYRRAIDVLRQSIAILEGELRYARTGTNVPSVRTRCWLASCLAELGEFAEGDGLCHRSRPDCRGGGVPQQWHLSAVEAWPACLVPGRPPARHSHARTCPGAMPCCGYPAFLVCDHSQPGPGLCVVPAGRRGPATARTGDGVGGHRDDTIYNDQSGRGIPPGRPPGGGAYPCRAPPGACPGAPGTGASGVCPVAPRRDRATARSLAGRAGHSPLPAGSGPGQRTWHAPTPGPLSSGPWHPVHHHRPAGAGPRRPNHRHRVLPRHGHDLLATAGRSDARASRVRGTEGLALPHLAMRAEASGQGGQAEAALGGLLAPLYGWCTEGFDRVDLQAARVLLQALEGEPALLSPPRHAFYCRCTLGGFFSMASHNSSTVFPAKSCSFNCT